jgi:hypothetical protein
MISLLLASASGVTRADTPAASRRAAVERFFHLREQMLDQRGTTADVDELLKLLADKAIYEHPAFKVSMTKADARRGMVAHLKESRDVKITIRQLLVGTDFAVAETTMRSIAADKPSDSTPTDRIGVAVFQFEGERIVRVAEY